MIASTLLAASAVAIAGALAASHQHDRAVRDDVAAARSAEELLEEALGMPFDSGDAAVPSIIDLDDFVETDRKPSVASGQTGALQDLASRVSEDASPPAADASATLRRVNVQRMSALNGTTAADGDLALVSISVPTAQGNTIELKRLVTRAEMNKP